MLKCQFHIHTKEDPLDLISYNAKQLIDHAKSKNFDVIAITLHTEFFDNPDIKSYAKKKNILLIPGIELSIGKQHVLVLNCDKEIENVKNFSELKIYKKQHKDCFIIAPHPYYPGNNCLHKSLEENLEIFDAIENSYCFTKNFSFNKKAKEFSDKKKLPFIATSDCHIIKYLDQSYFLLDSKKETKHIFDSIRKNKYENIQKPLWLFTVFKIIFLITSKELIKKLFFKRKSN